MRAKFIILVFSINLFFSCRDDERHLGPGERPDERIAAAIEQYKGALVSSEYGWKAVLYPGGGSGYSFYFNFLENDRVIMLSDINQETASETFESTYRIRAMQRPTLIFDTYSYIHILSDPDERKSGGTRGEGKYSDFEFTIESVSSETVTLTGKYNQSKLELKKATQHDAENYIRNISSQAYELQNIDNFTTYFKRLVTGEKTYDLDIDTNFRVLNLSYTDAGQIRRFITDYYFDEEGLAFMEPFTGDFNTISALKHISFESANNRILITVNDQRAIITSAPAPSQIDRNAALRVKQSQDYWGSFTGFTVEGNSDHYHLQEIQDFAFLVFWPNFGTDSGNVYDLLGFVYLTDDGVQIFYGIATISTISTDGRLINNYYGILGETNEEEEELIVNILDKWVHPSGFFVIEKGEGAIDLVSASDGKSWINLF